MGVAPKKRTGISARSDGRKRSIKRPLGPDGKPVVTEYERKVYDTISTIPEGFVSTYGLVAKATQSAPRSVGQALRRNPFAPKVPCHRVVTSSLELGGFNGSWGDETPQVKKKRGLLEAEGVKFNGNKIDGDCVFEFRSPKK